MTIELVNNDRASRASTLIKSLNANKIHKSRVSKNISRKSDDNFSSEKNDIKHKIQMLDDLGVINPYFRVAESVSNGGITINGKRYINFSGYNYLGYSGDERVNSAAKSAIDKFGTSPSASRLVSGEKTLHVELEEEIANFLDCESSVVFPSGHATNVTVIGHLFNADDLILYDELSHNSIIEGAVLSGARRIGFNHNDAEDCEKYIKKYSASYRRIAVITEGAYSMDGDIVHLDKFVELKRKYDTILYVDEAHSLGTMGETGGGVREYFGLKGNDVDFWMGTLSKSLSSNGGYIAGKKELMDYLRYTTPGFVFTAGITPANAAASLQVLRLIKTETHRVAALQENAQYFVQALRQAGFDVGLSKDTPIVPLIIRDVRKTVVLSDLLFNEGIISHPIFYPTVPQGEDRLRFFITSDHTHQQLDEVVEKIIKCTRKL